jgi:hypothetical protein
MKTLAIRNRVSSGDSFWCCNGTDTIPFSLPRCLTYKQARIAVLESRSGGRAAIATQPSIGQTGALQLTVEWFHGFFGAVAYRVEIDADERYSEGLDIFFEAAEVVPTEIVLGREFTLKVRLFNCGSKPVRAARGEYALTVEELAVLNSVTGEPTGDVKRLSDMPPALQRMFTKRINLDIPQGQDTEVDLTFTSPSPDTIPAWPLIRGEILGAYQMTVLLELIDLYSPAPPTAVAESGPIEIEIREG